MLLLYDLKENYEFFLQEPGALPQASMNRRRWR